MKRMVLLFSILFIASAQYAQNPSWECIGPEGGKVLSVRQDPANANTFYSIVAGVPSKVFKSTNGGDSWSNFSSIGAYNGLYGSFIIDERNPNVFYTTHYYQICKSTNSGSTWTPYFTAMINNQYGYIYDLAVDPGNSSIIYGCGDSDNGSPWVCTFYKSTNGGQSFSAVQFPNKTGALYNCIVDRQNSNIIYLAGYGYGTSYKNYVFKSTDGGSNFIEMPELSGASYGSLAGFTADTDNSQILYAGTLSGIFKSTNGGQSWTRMNFNIYNFRKFQTDSRNKIIYACCYGQIWKCADGNNWVLCSSGNFNNVNSLAYDNFSSSRLIMGTDLGLLRTTNSGSSWSSCNTNLIAGNVSVIKFAPSQPAILFAGLDDYCGTFKTTNALGKSAGTSSVNWIQLPTFYSCSALEDYLISPTNPDLILALEGGG